MHTNPTPTINVTGEATGFIPAPGSRGKPITVIGTQAIRDGFDAKCVEQALNSRGAPGVTGLVLNPDAHAGYGAPVGCVLVPPTHIYPGPAGVDIKCSMSPPAGPGRRWRLPLHGPLPACAGEHRRHRATPPRAFSRGAVGARRGRYSRVGRGT